MLEPLQNFMPTIAHNFAEPHVAVHVDKERALVNTGGLRVRGDGGVDELVPHLGDFRFAAALFEPKSFHQAGHHAGGGLGAVGAGAFLLAEVYAAPLG